MKKFHEMTEGELRTIINLPVIIVVVIFVIIAFLSDYGMKLVGFAALIVYILVIVIIATVAFLNIYVANNVTKYVNSKLKPNNIVSNLRLEVVEGTVNGLIIVAGYDIKNKHYKYISFYEGDGTVISSLVEEKGIDTIKTWIDFSIPNAFEFDINDLCEKLGLKSCFYLISSEACSNLRRANTAIKYLRKKM